MSRAWKVTGRRVPPTTLTVMGKTQPFCVDAPGTTVALVSNTRAVWAVVRRMDGRTEWVEILVNPAGPPFTRMGRLAP